jgi:hypothetical protein
MLKSIKLEHFSKVSVLNQFNKKAKAKQFSMLQGLYKPKKSSIDYCDKFFNILYQFLSTRWDSDKEHVSVNDSIKALMVQNIFIHLWCSNKLS